MGLLLRAIIIVVMVYFTWRLIFPPIPKRRLNKAKLGEIDEKSIRECFAESEKQLADMKEISLAAKSKQFKFQVKAINKVARYILDDFAKNPSHLSMSKRFLAYYLNTSEKLIKKYIELGAYDISSTEIERMQTDINKALALIENTLKRQLVKLLENTALDLDAEIAILRQTIETEDL